MAASRHHVKRMVSSVKKSTPVRPIGLRLSRRWLVGSSICTLALILLLAWKLVPADSTSRPSDASAAPRTTASLSDDPARSSVSAHAPLDPSAIAPIPEATGKGLLTSVPVREGVKGAGGRRVIDKQIANGQVTLLLKDEATGELSRLTRPIGTNMMVRKRSDDTPLMVNIPTTPKLPDAAKDIVSPQSIATIKVGMKVPTRNPITGKTEFKRVTNTFKHTAYEVVKLELADSKTGTVVDSLRGTPEHPFFTPSGMVAMGELKPEMRVITRRGSPLVVKSVTREPHPEGIPVYNFEVEGDHTYFVGKAEGGTWVHNDCIISTKMETLDLSSPSWKNTKLSGQLVYVLRDAETGEMLKVGSTTGETFLGRFPPYVAAGRRLGRQLSVDVFEIMGKRRTEVEKEIRKYLKGLGEELPWDNTGRLLGRPGKGVP